MADSKNINGLVKPLEFPEACPRGRRAESRPNSILKYTIAHYGGDVGEPVYRWASEGGSWSEPFYSYEAVKEAANGDYIDRVLTALNVDKYDGQTIRYDGTGQDAVQQMNNAGGRS